MKIRPTGSRVLIAPIDVPLKTHGGILLAEGWQQPSGQAVVIAVGARVQDENLKPGARVFYSWIDALEVQHAGQKCRLLFESQILGVQA